MYILCMYVCKKHSAKDKHQHNLEIYLGQTPMLYMIPLHCLHSRTNPHAIVVVAVIVLILSGFISHFAGAAVLNAAVNVCDAAESTPNSCAQLH